MWRPLKRGAEVRQSFCNRDWPARRNGTEPRLPTRVSTVFCRTNTARLAHGARFWRQSCEVCNKAFCLPGECSGGLKRVALQESSWNVSVSSLRVKYLASLGIGCSVAPTGCRAQKVPFAWGRTGFCPLPTGGPWTRSSPGKVLTQNTPPHEFIRPAPRPLAEDCFAPTAKIEPAGLGPVGVRSGGCFCARRLLFRR